MVSKLLLITLAIAYVEARFGQEQIPIPAIGAVQGGAPGAAGTISGAAISDLLGAANSCAKLQRADQVVSELGGGADAIAAAIGLVTAEKNTNPFANGNVQNVCGDPSLPATAELRGITPLIDPDVDAGGAAAALSASSAASPLNADGLSVFDLMSAAGLGDLVVSQAAAGGAAAGAAGAGNANAGNAGAGNANAGNAGAGNANAGNAGAANAGAGNANAGNANAGNANAGNANADNANADNAGAGGKAGGNAAGGNAAADNGAACNAGNAAAGNGTAAAGGNQNAGNGNAGNNNAGNGNAGNDNAGNDNAGNNNAGNGNAGNNKGNAGNGNAGNQNGGNGNAGNNNAGNDNAGNGNAGNGNAGNGNANQDAGNNAGNNADQGAANNNNNNNQGANNNNNANAGAGAADGAAAGGAADFGQCTPTIDLAGGRGNRPADELTFQITDPLARGGQQEALNPNIITNALCNQLTNVCGANAAAIAKCEDAKAQVAAAGTRDQSTADLFNSAIGFGGAAKRSVSRSMRRGLRL